MEEELWLKFATIAPGIAGMMFVMWLAYKRSNDSEKHVQVITSSFLAHIARKDVEMIEERAAHRQFIREMRSEHTVAYKNEQETFVKALERVEADHKNK